MKSNINRRGCFKSPLPPLKGGQSPSMRGQGGVKTILFLAFILTMVLMSSCKTKEVPGRRRTPRHCNTCTKWSYAPQVEGMDTLAFPPMQTKTIDLTFAER